jgi:hypothetical protein
VKRWSCVSAALVASSVLASAALAVPLSAPGILVSGSGSHFFKVCSTCPNDGSFDFDSDGGNYVGAAETTGFADTYYSWLADGVLVGPNALPVLKARAEAMDPSLSNPMVGIGTTSATADAQGLQEFHYSGTEDGTYTITFHVGTVFGDGETIGAGLSVLTSDYDPFTEGGLYNARIAYAELSESASVANGQFSETRDITFDVTADEDFFVLAYLTANAFFSDGGSMEGVADASHTFTASFTAGDVSLLTVVPEPATFASALLGLAAVAWARRGRSISR